MLRIGFEYLSQDMLNYTHKGYSLNKQRLIVDALNEAGIWIHAYFMIGTEDDYENAINFFDNNTEFYELFHTLEFFSQVDDRHSLEKLQKLSKGLINNADLDVNFPQFRIWYDLYPRARYLVKNLRRYAQDHFLLYGHFYEPSEVAYFPVLNNLYGLNNLNSIIKFLVAQERHTSSFFHLSDCVGFIRPIFLPERCLDAGFVEKISLFKSLVILANCCSGSLSVIIFRINCKKHSILIWRIRLPTVHAARLLSMQAFWSE